MTVTSPGPGHDGPSSAEVMLMVLDMLEAAAGASSKIEAVAAVRSVVAVLDPETAARVAVAVAVECSWSLRPRKSHRSLLEWIERTRLEVTWVAS